ncbi:MAG: hypothetical protein ABH832_00435 [bacterium]
MIFNALGRRKFFNDKDVSDSDNSELQKFSGEVVEINQDHLLSKEYIIDESKLRIITNATDSVPVSDFDVETIRVEFQALANEPDRFILKLINREIRAQLIWFFLYNYHLVDSKRYDELLPVLNRVGEVMYSNYLNEEQRKIYRKKMDSKNGGSGILFHLSHNLHELLNNPNPI